MRRNRRPRRAEGRESGIDVTNPGDHLVLRVEREVAGMFANQPVVVLQPSGCSGATQTTVHVGRLSRPTPGRVAAIALASAPPTWEWSRC